MTHRPFYITVVLAQLLIVLSLQTWGYLPAATRWAAEHHGGACRHGNRLCTCPPERVAAGACCCSRTTAPKGVFDLTDLTTDKGKQHSCCNRTASPTRYLCAIPCGARPDITTPAPDSAPFLRQGPTGMALRPSFGIIAVADPLPLHGRTLPPPDPPPKPYSRC